MLDKWKARLGGVFRRRTPASSRVTERSTLAEIAAIYPTLYEFLLRRYAVRLEEREKHRTLGECVRLNGLPPAQVVFMEMQLEHRSARVPHVPAREAATLIAGSHWQVLDVRESWELNHGKIPGSAPIDPSLWEKILADWERETPILIYCHFGIRSLDAANQLLDRGFKNVHVLQGGIDAWSQDVDPSVTRYEGSWC
jgi:rhodanese-related sulfurtransferase